MCWSNRRSLSHEAELASSAGGSRHASNAAMTLLAAKVKEGAGEDGHRPAPTQQSTVTNCVLQLASYILLLNNHTSQSLRAANSCPRLLLHY